MTPGYPAPDSYRIAIPTYRRAATVRDKTLATLARGGIERSRITLWVADEQQAAEYYATVPRELYGDLCVSAPGLGQSRNVINRAYAEGSFLLCADDDLADIYRKHGSNGRAPVTDLHGLFTELFTELAASRLTLVGIHPVDNPYLQRPGYSTNLRYIIGALFGLHIRHEPWYDVTLEDKEDYERTIQHFLHAGGVLRRNDVGMVTRYYREPGGMQETRTEQRVHESAVLLANRYPDLVRLRTSKAGHTEIAFRKLPIRRSA